MALVVEAAGLSDTGRKRKGNEDSLFLDEGIGLFVVADGMGGHLAGEVASKVVVNTMEDYIRRFHEQKNAEKLDDFDSDLSVQANRLLASISLANRAVHEMAKNKQAYTGMGSTVSAAYLTETGFVVANVGDSPIYLVHNNQMQEVSVPHTVIAEQAALDPNAAGRLGDKFAHMLTRAMGVEEGVKADACEIQAFPGDILVLASDGLTNLVSMRDIQKTVTGEKPEQACRKLVEMANENGGDDNITVIVLKVKQVGVSGGFFKNAFSRFLNFFK
jgi:protein phosphatase